MFCIAICRLQTIGTTSLESTNRVRSIVRAIVQRIVFPPLGTSLLASDERPLLQRWIRTRHRTDSRLSRDGHLDGECVHPSGAKLPAVQRYTVRHDSRTAYHSSREILTR